MKFLEILMELLQLRKSENPEFQFDVVSIVVVFGSVWVAETSFGQ